MTHLFFLSGLAFVLAMSSATAADWARFRGPNGSGVVDGEMPRIDPKDSQWMVAIPGKGSGSPIVVEGKVYLQTAAKDGSSRTLMCLDAADGKTLWKTDATGKTAATHAKNSLASGTPASDGKMVYCAWWDGSEVAIHAYDIEGQEKWTASLGGYVSQHGPGMSPVLHGGLVFVNVDDDERAELVALDANTGEKKWVERRKHERACYSSPFISRRGDKPEELVLGTTHAITAYEPATGKVIWNYPVIWPKGKSPLRVIGHPVFVGGLIVMSCGDGKGDRYMIAVDTEKRTPAKVWDMEKASLPYVPCMLVKDDLLFWIGDHRGGHACCADAKTGKVLFSEQVTVKEPSASPVMIGDKILMVTDVGDAVVFKAAKEFEEVARTKLGEGVVASPAVADGRVFIRGTTHMFCFGKK